MSSMTNDDGNFSKYLNDYLAGGMDTASAIALAKVASGKKSSSWGPPITVKTELKLADTLEPVVATKAGFLSEINKAFSKTALPMPGDKSPPKIEPPAPAPPSVFPPLLVPPVAKVESPVWYRDPFVITGIVFGSVLTAATVTALVIIAKKA